MSRIEMGGGTKQFFCDFDNGSDLTGDGTSGTPWKTLQHACGEILYKYDFSGAGGSTRAEIILAEGTTDTTGLHFSPHSFVGAQGGAGLKIKGAGAGASVIPTVDAALQFYFGFVGQIENLTIGAPAGKHGIEVVDGAVLYINSDVRFVDCGVSQIRLANGTILMQGDIDLDGDADYFVLNGGGKFATNGHDININNDLDYSRFAYCVAPCMTSFQNTDINLNGNTVTGKRYEAYNNAILFSNGGSATYFPGDTSGSTFNGGQYL